MTTPGVASGKGAIDPPGRIATCRGIQVTQGMQGPSRLQSVEGEGTRLDWLRKYTMRLPELGPKALSVLSTVVIATGFAAVVVLATGIATFIGRGLAGHWLWNEIPRDRVKYGISFMEAAYLEILHPHLHLAVFIICCFLGPVIGRRLGWIISRRADSERLPHRRWLPAAGLEELGLF
jgi:hypothetical protein